MEQTGVVNGIKLFSSSLMNSQNKLICTLKPSLIILSEERAYPSEVIPVRSLSTDFGNGSIIALTFNFEKSVDFTSPAIFATSATPA
jgi:hypothetical protein